MNKYRIGREGADCEVYEGETEAEALEAFARDTKGPKSRKDLIVTVLPWKSINELFDAMVEDDPLTLTRNDCYRWDGIPNFGGVEPDDDEYAYSWSPDRMIVDDDGTLVLIDRETGEEVRSNFTQIVARRI